LRHRFLPSLCTTNCDDTRDERRRRCIYVPSAAALALAKGETTRDSNATMKQSRDTDSSEVIDGGNTAIALFAQFYVFDFGLRNGWHVNWLLFYSDSGEPFIFSRLRSKCALFLVIKIFFHYLFRFKRSPIPRNNLPLIFFSLYKYIIIITLYRLYFLLIISQPCRIYRIPFLHRTT